MWSSRGSAGLVELLFELAGVIESWVICDDRPSEPDVGPRRSRWATESRR